MEITMKQENLVSEVDRLKSKFDYLEKRLEDLNQGKAENVIEIEAGMMEVIEHLNDVVIFLQKEGYSKKAVNDMREFKTQCVSALRMVRFSHAIGKLFGK